MTLNKVYETKFVQIYMDSSKSKKNEQYEYIYRYINSEIQDVQIYKSDQFPYNLLTISTGFLFVHNNADVPILPNDDYNDYKTNIRCISNGFINKKDINTVLNFRPSKGCHPNCMKNYMIGLNIQLGINKLENINEMYKHFIEIQPKFKNLKEWKKYICENCPSKIHYMETINDKTFQKKITENDIIVDYDIHDVHEIEIIKIIENTFENMNQTIKIFDNYNNIVDRIKNECDKKKIKYTSSENTKHTKLKYKGKLKLNRFKGIKWIELKYSDLLKCDIKYLLTDFIS